MSTAAAAAWAMHGGADRAEQFGDVIDWLIARIRDADCSELISLVDDDVRVMAFVDPCEAMIKELENARALVDTACAVVQNVIARMPD